MIAGIGVDACEVERIRHALEAGYGVRFRTRVFTEAEQAYCESRRRGRFESYAARFAAKEAAMKVLATGWSDGIAWRDIEVVRLPGGPPELRLHGRAAAIARRLGMGRWLVTLTHTRTEALAWVVAQRVTGRRPGRRAGEAGAGAPRPRPRR